MIWKTICTAGNSCTGRVLWDLLYKNASSKEARNPAFLGFDLQYIGVFLLYCNPWTALCSAFAIIMLHLQILQEEQYLSQEFGAPYVEYKSRVFRYLGQRRQG